MVLFIALPETEKQDRPGVTSIPLELLPRRCPFCGERTIIGPRTAVQTSARPTAPTDPDSPGPVSSLPEDIYGTARLVAAVRALQPHCRQQAWESLREADRSWERSVPDIADATRSPEPSTVRRWAERLLHLGTLLTAKLWQATNWSASTPPTILAWDWMAIRRILPLEARSP